MTFWTRWFAPRADTVGGAQHVSAQPGPRPPTHPDRNLIAPHWTQGERMTRRAERQLHRVPTSFVDFLQWRDWDPESGCFILADCRSAGILYELTPAPTEGRDARTLQQLHEAFTQAIRTGLIEDADSPWIAQFYVQDEASLYAFWRRCQEAIAPDARDTAFTRAWMQEVDQHLQQVASRDGVFAAGDQPWRGKERRMFVALFRHAPSRSHLGDSIQRCAEAANQFQAAFQTHGVVLRRCRGRDLVEWMMPMLNPAPQITDGDPYAYMRLADYPNEVDGPMPPAWDLGEHCIRSTPELLPDGVWSFQGQLVTALTTQQWTKPLTFGCLTGEDKAAQTLMDQLPEGTRVATTVIAEPQYLIDRHLTMISTSAVGDGAHASHTLREVDSARKAMAAGEKLYRVALVFYVTASTQSELQARAQRCAALMTRAGLPVYEHKYDLFRATAFVDNLPFGFKHQRDREGPQRATLQYTSEIAKLIPVAGRSIGTGSACLNYFNRGAEPLSFDPIRDRLRNAHMTVFGPTGSGKSAALTNALAQVMAVHRPFLWIIDPKWPAPSFTLLVQYFKTHGLSVNHVQLTPESGVSLNPFHNALQLLDPEFAPQRGDDDDVEGGRDLLGEMVYLAIAMITGGEQKEIDELRRADRPVIGDAILRAASDAKARGAESVLTQDVVQALHAIAETARSQPGGELAARKYSEMANAMRYFTQGAAGAIFNRPGTPWPTVDVTLIEFATLGTQGYDDQLAVGFMSLIQAIQLHITRHQFGKRNTVVVADEVHTLAKNPLMGAYIAKAIKTWRSAGAWYWQATQSIEDFSGPMKPLLTQLEWMLCLSMPKYEVTKLKELKELTDEQATMIESATKSPGEYAEGVVLHERFTALFRAVFPAMALALAQTEQHERSARRDLMVKHGCDEITATHHVRDQIIEARAQHARKRQVQAWRDRA